LEKGEVEMIGKAIVTTGIAALLVLSSGADDSEGKTGWRDAGSGTRFHAACEYRVLVDSENSDPDHYYYMSAVAEHELVFFSDSDTFRIIPTERYRWVRLGDQHIFKVLKLEERC